MVQNLVEQVILVVEPIGIEACYNNKLGFNFDVPKSYPRAKTE